MNIGVDIGGTKILAVLTDDAGTVLKEQRVSTEPNRGRQTVLDHIEQVIHGVWDDAVTHIGFGVPGVVQHGTIAFIPNIPALLGFDLLAWAEKTFSTRCSAENDANCFTLAEARLGAAKADTIVVGIILGTGVGGGIVINKQLFSGAHGCAGEFGWMFSEFDAQEDVLSGHGIEMQYYEISGQHKTAQAIFAERSPTAKRVLNNWMADLSQVVANICIALDPHVVVFGGGVSNEDFYEELTEHVHDQLLAPQQGKIRFVRGSVKDGGAVGAALLHLG